MDFDILAAARCLIDYAREHIAPDGAPEPEPGSYAADVFAAAQALESYLDAG